MFSDLEIVRNFANFYLAHYSVVNKRPSYEIPIFGLENKQYEYDFVLGDSFFEALEQNLIQHGAFRVHVVLDKSTTMIRLDLCIRGTIELICDRSLEPFEESMEIEGHQFLKFADRAEELTDEIELIPWDTTHIHIARYIFEFIALSLPMKKVHPRFRQVASENEDDASEGAVVYCSDPVGLETEPEEAPIDPRWEALKKFKNERET